MKGIPSNVTRGLPIGARIKCIDNSGAKVVQIITVMRYHGVHRRLAAGGVGDLVVVAVKKGTPEMRHQMVYAVIVRQRRPFTRSNGVTVQFEDNAVVITTPTGETKGTDIKGPVAREAAERWPRIAATASMIV